MHHQRIYQYGDRPRQKLLSYAGTLLLPLWVLIGAFAIQWWIVAVAMGGLIQTIKSVTYGFDRSRPEAARNYWREGGLKTFGNVGLALAGGVAFALYIPTQHLTRQSLLAWYYVIALMLTYSAGYLYRQHITAGAAARYRGLLFRRTARVNPIPTGRGS